MKNALVKDFLREIKTSLSRVFSILLIVALGVAFFSGIRASEPDMKLSADSLYDKSDFMDIRVLGDLGLTDYDLSQISNIDGIAAAEGSKNVQAVTLCGNYDFILDITSMPENLNRPTLTEGTMPQTPSQCLMDTELRDYYEIGDTVEVYRDDGEDLSDYINTTTFTITGFATSPNYLDIDRGNTDIGNGTIKAFVLVPEEAFVMDYYTVIYATVDGAKDLQCMTDEYDSHISPVTDALEGIAAAQCSYRYTEVLKEPLEKIDDAQTEMATGALKSGASTMAGYAKLRSGQLAINEAQTTIAENGSELEDAATQLDEGRKQLEEARNALENSKAEYESGLNEYNSGVSEAALALEKLNSNEASLAQAQAQIDDGHAQLETAKSQLDEAKSTAESAINTRSELESNLSAAQAALSQFPENEELQASIAQIEAALAQIPSMTELEASLATINENYAAYEDQYTQLEAAQAEVDSGRAALDDAWEEYYAGQESLETAKEQLDAAKQQLDDAQGQIDSNAATLESSQQELDDGRAQLESAKTELENSQSDLESGFSELLSGAMDANAELSDARKKIDDGLDEIADISYPEWYVLDRNSTESYVEYQMDAERIGALGDVFPVIFFLVAALVSLTTMTRMVSEKRTQIGTLKALGYSDFSISMIFFMYALLAAGIGSVLGFIIGGKLLPFVILSAYGTMYIGVTDFVIPINIGLSLISTAIAIGCTAGATLLACHKELSSVPAALIREEPPARGSHVWVEKMGFLWRRLSFTGKSTLRNLIRYKKRFFMTVFGIGGCMALVMMAFGIRDSVAKIADTQYETVWKYDASVSLETDTDYNAIKENIVDGTNITSAMAAYKIAKSANAGGMEKNIYLFVPEDGVLLSDYIDIHSRTTGDSYTISDDGVIITEKLAKMLDVEAGGTINITGEGGTDPKQMTVTAIAENYIYHYIYMSETLYEKLYGEPAPCNTLLLLLTDDGRAAEDTLGDFIISQDGVLSVEFATALQEHVDGMMDSLTSVVWVLILAASLLAFIVLYNLNNINLIERRREMATLKVLGFYNIETSGFIYRENIFLTAFGIVVGVFIGILLHKYTITTLEVDMLMFGQTIHAASYFISAAITCAFAIVVNFFVFFKIRAIDMVESLKSVD